MQREDVKAATGALLRRLLALCTRRYEKGRPWGAEFKLKEFMVGHLLLVYHTNHPSSKVTPPLQAVFEVILLVERMVLERLPHHKALLPALRRFHATHAAWIHPCKGIFLMERAYEVAELHVRCRLTPPNHPQRRRVMGQRTRAIKAKTEELSGWGGHTACTYLQEVVRGALKGLRSAPIQGPYLPIPRDAHALAVDPRLTHNQGPEAEILKRLRWELISAQLSLRPLPYCWRAVAAMRGLRCSQGVDLDVVKDLMESGAWSMRLNDDLMAQLCPALVSTWRAFVAAHDARAPWQVWLCAMLQFLENEEAAELERAEAGRDVVAAERALFEGRPTPITDRLLLAALRKLPSSEVVAARDSVMSFIAFQRGFVLDAVLHPTDEMLEILALDHPHIHNMRAELQHWSMALALMIAAQTQFHEPAILQGFAARLSTAPIHLGHAADHFARLCWAHAQDPQQERIAWVTTLVHAMTQQRLKAATQTISLWCRCLVENKVPVQCPLLVLLGAVGPLDMLAERLARLIILNRMVHHGTYMRAIRQTCL